MVSRENETIHHWFVGAFKQTVPCDFSLVTASAARQFGKKIKSESPTVPRKRVERSDSLTPSSHSRRAFTQAPRSAALFPSAADAGEVVFLSALLQEVSRLS